MTDPILPPDHELRPVIETALRNLGSLPSHPHAQAGPAGATADGPPAEDTLPPILGWDEMMATLETEGLPPEIIESVLHKGCRACISGASKAGKTWSLVNLAVAVAAGRPWLGLKTNPSRVLYLDFELHPAFAKQRFKMVREKMDVPESMLKSTLKYWSLRDNYTPFEALISCMKLRGMHAGFDVIILDPYYKISTSGGFDENAAGDVMEILSLIGRFSKATGAAFIWSHHFSKGNKADVDHLDRASGSGVFARDPDSILTLTKHAEPDCMTLEATLRNAPPIPDRVVEFSQATFPAFVHRDDLEADDLHRANPRRAPGRPGEGAPTRTVAEVLERHGNRLGWNAWKELCLTEEGISGRKFKEAASALRTAGRIETHEEGPGKPTFHSLKTGTV